MEKKSNAYFVVFFKRWILPVVIPYLIGFSISDYLLQYKHFKHAAGELIPEFIIAILTIFVLGRFSSFRSRSIKKASLYRRAHSRDNLVAIGALEDLRIEGFDIGPKKGVLDRLELRGSNWMNGNLSYFSLQRCDLLRANLQHADFSYCNLKGANVNVEQLVLCSNLKGAIMPDGSLYDGRYNLEDDLSEKKRMAAKRNAELTNVDIANIYGIELKTYMEGQMWAEKNLAIIMDRVNSS